VGINGYMFGSDGQGFTGVKETKIFHNVLAVNQDSLSPNSLLNIWFI